jgi:peptidoglycan/LPS O-acetylase OafA/YrhL
VVFFHTASPPILHGLTRDTPTGRIILGLYDTAFNGQAAVIAFFVISGFCIHVPYAAGRAFAATPFLLGRVARILIPTGAYLLALRFSHRMESAFTLLLWSIWCEIVYYVLYPLLRVTFARTSVRFVLLCSYAGAAIVTARYAFGLNWNALFDADRWTWVAGLPCWLLGCLLAEHVCRQQSRSTISPMGLQVFAGYTYFWLAAEIQWCREHGANRVLEWLGGLTFSIYLIHQLAKSFLESGMTTSGWAGWIATLGFILALSATFYALVEAPSHRLGRFLSRRGRLTTTQ